jgi:PAS domain S-box-containing protein
MTSATKFQQELLAENETLRLRLEEAEETLRAIGSGEVDAFVVSGQDGEQQVFTLKGAELPYRILVESMNEGAATLAADGTILYSNKRLSTLLKISLENLIGTELSSYVETNSYLTYAALLENCTQESISEEITMMTAAGNSIPVFISCCANDISGTQGISVVVTDLTLQRRNAEILASEKFSTSIVEQSSAALIVCDAKGKIIRASQTAHALCGKNPLLKQFNTIFPLNTAESGKKLSIVQLMRAGNVTCTEVEFKRGDRQKYNLLLNATTLRNLQNCDIGIVITLTDVTGRKTAEMELQQSEIRLQSAYSHLQVVNEELQAASEELQVQSDELQNQNQELQKLWERSKQSEEALRVNEQRLVLASRAGKLGLFEWNAGATEAFWNAKHYELLGLEPGSPATFEAWQARVHPDDRDRVMRSTANLIAEAQSGKRIESHHDEYRALWPDGTAVWLESVVSVEFDGNVVMRGAVRDITERKQAEEALKESEEQFRVLIQNLQSAVALINEIGEFTIVNQSFLRIFELDDKSTIKNVNDRDWSQWQVLDENGLFLDVDDHPVRKAALTGKSVRDRLVAVKAPGNSELKWLLVSAEPILDNHGHIHRLICTYHDISVQKKTEKDLLDSEDRLQFALETIHTGAWDLDLDDHSSFRSVEHDNIFGYPVLLPEWTYEMFIEHVVQEDRETVNNKFLRAIEIKGDWDFECRIRRADGELRWIRAAGRHRNDINGGSSRLAGIVQDITEQKQVEKALQQSEDQLRTLANSISNLAWWANSDGYITWYNHRWYEYTGTKPEQMEGWGWQSVHDPEELPKVLERWQVSLKTGEPFEMIFPLRGADGIFRPFLTRVIPLKDDAGHVLQWFGTNTDVSELEQRVAERTKELAVTIDHLQREMLERESAEKKLLEETTERLQATEALREKERMLIHQSRQAAMGEMIGNIAHQWRQPLNALGLYTQKLGTVYGMPNFNKEFLDNSIVKTMEIIKHMSKTIDDFRDYFKPEKEKTDFYVIEAIKRTLSLLEGNFHSPNITIDCVEHGNPVINGYQNEFAQVVLNILNNARDAIIEREVNDPRIIITICSENNCAVVTVKDNAGGIPDEVINKVFDPYFTTKGPQVGTGIGLFMSKTIIEKNMGGRLTVHNTDTGAEFRIEVEHGTQN